MSSPPEPLPAPAGTGDERAILEGFLDQYRTIVARKAFGLDDALARRRLVDSGTTAAGLVRHLRWVEQAWFVEALEGHQRPTWRDTDPQWQFRPGAETLQELITDYEAACTHSRQIAAQHTLDAVGHNPRLGTVSLRWIYLHMIEETARHAGQLDILLEQLDGRVGFD